MTSHQVKQWLTEYAEMRQRKNKDKYLFALVLKHHGIELTQQLKAKAHDIMGDLLSADRQWRKVLEENPELRTEDYSDGERLSQEYQLGLGYEPNYKQDSKILERVSASGEDWHSPTCVGG